jgi:cell division septum initiation protein DivIVA
MPLINLILDCAVILMVAVGIFYALRLSRQLNDFKADKKALDDMVKSLDLAANKAEDAIKKMRQSALTTADDLNAKINKGRGIGDELILMIEAGDNLAERLQKLASTAAKTHSHADDKPPPAPTSDVPDVIEPRSKAERDLLNALKNKNREG